MTRRAFPGSAMTSSSLNVIRAGVIIALLGHCAAAVREPCLWEESVNITSGVVDSAGNYHHNGVLYKPHQYATYKYVMVFTERRTVRAHVRGCLCAARGVPCLPYCCSTGDECPDEISKDFGINVTEVGTTESRLENIHDVFQPIQYKPCEFMFVLNPDEYPDEQYVLYSDGSLDRATKETDPFCISHNGNTSQMRVCFVSTDPIKFRIYPYTMLISVPFLIVTFLVYGLIPELRNLHGKNLMSYVSSLTVAYVCMSIIHLHTQSLSHLDHCAILGYTTYFAFLSSFFWLNILCFDIWWTFRGVRGMVRDLEKRKFQLYSIYGWGCPILILIWCVLTDNLNFIPMEYQPRIGHRSCFLHDDRLIMFIYLYIIMILQLVANLSLFVCTSYQIRKLQRETAQITNKGDSRKFTKMEADKDRYSLYLRLFIVMGVSWLAEVISYALPAGTAEWYSYVTDIFNSLQGFFIFFLFVWKPKVKALIVKRYRVLRGLQSATSTSYGFRSSTQTTTSNVYSRQSTINGNQSLKLKNINTVNIPEQKLLNGDERNGESLTDRD